MVKDATTLRTNKKPAGHPQPVFLFNYVTCSFIAGLRSPLAEVRLPTSFALAIGTVTSQCGGVGGSTLPPQTLRPICIQLSVNGAGFHDCHRFRMSLALMTAHQPEGFYTTCRVPTTRTLSLRFLRGFTAVCPVEKCRHISPWAPPVPFDIISIPHCQPKVKYF